MSNIKKYFTSRWDDGFIVEADLCLAKGTKVLTEDFKHVPIETIKEGDTLVGFDEDIANYRKCKFRSGKVEKTRTIVKPCYKLVLEDGTSIIASEDHMWPASKLSSSWGTKVKWVETKSLSTKHCLTKVTEVWESPESWETGYMAGLLDGEGSLHYNGGVCFGQNPGKVLDEFLRISEKYGFDCRTSLPNPESKPTNYGHVSKVVKIRPAGLRPGWKMLGMFQPKRLLDNLKNVYTNQHINGKRNRKVRIQSIEFVGDQEVVAVQTSCKTYIVEGLASHNCQIEIVVLGFLTQDKQLLLDLKNGIDFHCKRTAYKHGLHYDNVWNAVHVDKDSYWIGERKKAKQFSFQRSYGAGAKAISESTGMPINEVKKFIRAEEELYPTVVKVQQDWVKEVESNAKPSKNKSPSGLPLKIGWMKSPSGRRYVFRQSEWTQTILSRPGGPGTSTTVSFKPTEIKNYIVQGTAAELMILWIGRIWRELKANKGHKDNVLMINTIHDSVLFDVRDRRYMDKLVEIVQKCTEELPKLYEYWYKRNFNCKIRSDIKYGKNWMEQEEYK